MRGGPVRFWLAGGICPDVHIAVDVLIDRESHMGRINSATASLIWKRVIKGALRREDIDLSCVSYDGTNFYTFIDTF